VDINKKENRNNAERWGYEAGYEIGVFDGEFYRY